MAFRFGFQRRYVDIVEEKLYNLDTFNLTPIDHTIQLKSPDRAVCLLCSTLLQLPLTPENLSEHFSSGHREISEDVFNAYHKTFLSLYPTNQVHQIYFDPCDIINVFCCVCHLKVKQSNIINHLRASRHVFNVEESGEIFWLDVKSKDKKKKNRKNAKNVGKKLKDGQNEGQIGQSLLVDGINGLNICTNGSTLENRPIENQPIENQPIENQPIANQPIENQPIENQPFENQPIERKPIKNLPIEKRPIETPIKKRPIQKKIVIPSMVVTPSKTESQRVESTIEPMKKPTIPKIAQPSLKNDIKKTPMEKSTMVPSIMGSTMGPPTKKPMDTPFIPSSTNEMEQSIKKSTMEQNHQYGTIDPDYEENTLMVVYPSCNTPQGARRPSVLVVQKRSGARYFCISCVMPVYRDAALKHLSSPHHQRTLQNKWGALVQYHEYWSAKRGDRQLDQIYFCPSNKNMILCLLCNGKISYMDVEHHFCYKITCRLSELLEGYKNFTNTYADDVFTKYFSGDAFQTAQYLLRLRVPVSMKNGKEIVCMLCNQTMAKSDVPKYHSHLLYKHVFGKQQNLVESLKMIADYHKFWMSQTSEHQNFLSSFRTHSSTHFLCLIDNTLVPINETIEHFVQEHNDNATIEDPIVKPKKEDFPHELIKCQTSNPSETCDLNALLPEYLHDHVKVLQKNADESVSCTLCPLTWMDFQLDEVQNHIASYQHKSKLRVIVRFYCELCAIYYHGNHSKYLQHFDSTKHKNRVTSLGESRKQSLGEYFCKACQLVIYGDSISALRHNTGKEAVSKKSTGKVTLPKGIVDLFKSPSTIELYARRSLEDTRSYLERMTPKIERCLKDFEDTIGTLYPECEAHRFGSTVAALCSEGSDLDVFVDVGGLYDGATKQGCKEQQRIVIDVKNLLKQHPRRFAQLHCVMSARVPIIKVIHEETDIDCDLSFRNGLSVENTRFIKFCTELQPTFHTSLLLLKRWGAYLTPPLKESMTSYALCMMLVFYMQTRRLLLSVAELRNAAILSIAEQSSLTCASAQQQPITTKTSMIDGWETVDLDRMEKELPTLKAQLLRDSNDDEVSVTDVITGFMKYYADFDYETKVVCPLLGYPVDVKLFVDEEGATDDINSGDEKVNGLPREMLNYRRKLADDPECKFRTSCFMFVQDPYDLGHNLTKSAPKAFPPRFARYCQLTHDHIVKTSRKTKI